MIIILIMVRIIGVIHNYDDDVNGDNNNNIIKIMIVIKGIIMFIIGKIMRTLSFIDYRDDNDDVYYNNKVYDAKKGILTMIKRSMG